MKVLHVVAHFHPCIGGIETFVLDLCNYLKKGRHEVGVVCYNKCAHSSKKLPESEEFNGIKIYRIPFLNLKFYSLAPRVLRFVKEFDVIHVHNVGFFSDYLIATRFLHKKPIIVSTHGGPFHTKTLLPLKNLYFFGLQRFVLDKANAVIADSYNDLNLFKKISKKAELIEDGVDVSKFLKLKKKKQKNLFLFIGRMSKNKRIDLLVNAMEKVAAKEPSAKLVIIGEDWGHIMNDLKKLVKEKKLEKNVQFTGRISAEELMEFISRAEFFVSASQYEGFGISALECMAAKCIPILSDIESFHNFVKAKENNGFITGFYDADAAAETILKAMALGEKEKQAIALNAANTTKRFAWAKQIKQYELAYEQAIKGSKSI